MMHTIDYAKQLVDLSTASANNYIANKSHIEGRGGSNIRPVSAYLGTQQHAQSQQAINQAAASQKMLRPQTAFTQQSSQSTIISARTGPPQSHLHDRGHSLNTISYSDNKSSAFGIEGYKMPYHGLPPREPKYSVPRDKLQNFLQQTQRRGKLLPAPNQYHKPLTWETKNGQFGKNSIRKTFTDDAIKHSKQVPAPNVYNNEKKQKVLLGKSNRAEGFDFMSEVQYLGQINPSATSYNPDKLKLMKRSSSWAIKKPIKEKDPGWRPKKTKDPDVGTYETAKSKTFIKTKHPVISFTKSKSIKFTVEYSNSKKHIPGSAAYKWEPCFDKISVPYMKKRY
ncbi:UNKNOWN [Stylonychia lemnae]|uniref:Uncharacterized protein n=1 Tax=Stylonychia lemnae TaxID=5949 RepID=A0A078AIZ9_STYLE|nr:UNKNOWN [Stylonychia lemnae]|eukprot:CDW82305.1 UNKNOWN [Stylonychia lemnae]